MNSQTIVGLHTEAPAATGLVSVLVPCLGQLEYTRLCVPSLLRHSRPPYELIFLDIGSLDGTAEYLAGLQCGVSMGRVGGAGPSIQVVRTATDLGLPAAIQDALARARGEFLVLLNNDTVVTENWLQQLTALANMAPQVGLAGPMSNCAAPPQLVEAIPYRLGPKRRGQPSAVGLVEPPQFDVGLVEQFARTFCQEHKGKWMDVERLGGFCLLLKRAVLDAVGPLPTDTGLGIFDTDTLCASARRSGWTLALCRDLFIHHFGSRTFAHGGPVNS